MLCKTTVCVLVSFVQHQPNEVKARHEVRRKINVLHDRLPLVIGGIFWIRGSQDGAASVEAAHDAALGNRDSLLLHHFMENGPRVLIHLVELVNATDTTVRKHQGAALQNEILGVWISGDIGCQTNAT